MMDITGKTFVFPSDVSVDPLQLPHAGSMVHVVATKIPANWAEVNCPARGLSESEKAKVLVRHNWVKRSLFS